MSDIGDMTVAISCDPSDITAGMTEARDQIEQTTRTIEIQEQGWLAFSSSVIGSIARIAGPAIELVAAYKRVQAATIAMAAANAMATPPTLTLGAAVNFLLSPITLTVAALALLAGALYYFSQSGSEATDSTESLSDAVGTVAPHLSMLGQLFESLKTGFISDESVQKIGNISTEYQKLQGAINELGVQLFQPFLDGANAIAVYLGNLIGVESVLDGVTKSIQFVSGEVERVTRAVEAGQTAFLAMSIAMSSGTDPAIAQSYVEQARAIRDAAKASEELKERLESQRSAFATIREIQEDAAAKAQNAAEVARIGQIYAVEAVEAEILALQQRNMLVDAATRADKDYQDDFASKINAMERQKQGLIDGTIVDKEAEAAKRALAKAAEDAARAAQVESDAQDKVVKSGAQQIQQLQDQIDLLNGVTTQADIAARKALEAGLHEDVATEIARLTEEKERLEKEKNKKADKTEMKAKYQGVGALQQGSAEALSAIFKATRGPDELQKKAVEVAEKQAEHLENIDEKLAHGDVTIVAGGPV